jgi:hypothetical protein
MASKVKNSLFSGLDQRILAFVAASGAVPNKLPKNTRLTGKPCLSLAAHQTTLLSIARLPGFFLRLQGVYYHKLNKQSIPKPAPPDRNFATLQCSDSSPLLDLRPAFPHNPNA